MFITVLQQLHHIVHTAGARVSCAYYWVTSSCCVTRTEYRQTFCRRNMPAKSTIHNSTQKLEKTSSVLVEHIKHHWQMPKAMTADVSARLYQSNLRFKVCKSVHHRTIQINHQPDAIIFQFIILTFIYSSTCFGRSPAHHQ